MSNDTFLPSGRTSLVKRGDTPLQVQTEYAHRPNPRITTCILNNGRILHKIELTLETPVQSLEQQQLAEKMIKKQHAEVLAILENHPIATAEAVPPATQPPAPSAPPRPLSTQEQIAAVPGVQRIYRLNPDGTFVGSSSSEQFRKQFAPVFKSLHELLEVFDRVPAPGLVRRIGVYEVELDRLYLISIGSECIFALVRRVDPKTNYEMAFKEILGTLEG